MRTALAFLIFLSSFTGCASIEHTSSAQQSIDQVAIAGVGDVVLRIDKQRNLENAFGKADIFGRKTNEGYFELRFAGVEKTGEIVLYRKDLRIVTNETTMSRTPMSATAGSASTSISGPYSNYGQVGSLNASAKTNYASTTIAPIGDFHVVVPAEAIVVRLTPSETRLPMEGYIIEIIRATANSLEYRITKQ